MSETEDLRRKLAACQAYNETLTRHVMSMIATVKAKGAPNAATIIFACEEMLRRAWRAGTTPQRGEGGAA
jgi:hypothetical protein